MINIKISFTKGEIAMYDTIWAAIIGGVCTIVAALTGLIINRKLKERVNSYEYNLPVRFLEPNENFQNILDKAKQIFMYTVNSHELLNKVNTILEQDPKIVINEIIIMVRYKQDENAKDIEILNRNINLWKAWVDKKRIKKLKIVGYSHDPDHYYTVIGDRVAFAGQVLFDKSKPTGTAVDYLPLVFSDNTDIGKQVIKNYQRHFKNIIKHYESELKLYDSTEIT